MWFRVVCRHSRVGQQQTLTTVVTHIVVDKSTDNSKPHSICFIPQYQRQRKCFLQSVTYWREQRSLDSYRQRQISQSDCEISSKWGKTIFWHEDIIDHLFISFSAVLIYDLSYIHLQYSHMVPRLSGQTSIFGGVSFVSKSLLGIETKET